MNVLFDFKNTSKSYDQQPVFSQLNQKIFEGEFLVILGPSGCGKSSLLRTVAGLESFNDGQMSGPGSDLDKGFVFQDSVLLPWLTVEENMDLSNRLQGNAKTLATDLEETLKMVNLATARMQFPHQLSGGMKMRTSLGRALIKRPRVLLLDEPFSALDEMTREDLQVNLRKITDEHKITTIFVTHSMSEAAFLADRVWIFGRRGRGFRSEYTLDSKISRTESYRQSENYLINVATLSKKLREASQ